MKQFFIILSFVTSTLICSGQSLFFDTLKNSTWTTKELYTDKTINAVKEIALTIYTDKDTLNVDRNLWFFADALDIRFYSARSRCVSDISRLKYIIDKDKSIFKIVLADKTTLTYRVGITSTGNHALLIRQ